MRCRELTNLEPNTEAKMAMTMAINRCSCDFITALSNSSLKFKPVNNDFEMERDVATKVAGRLSRTSTKLLTDDTPKIV
jgi:hypothetical protein